MRRRLTWISAAVGVLVVLAVVALLVAPRTTWTPSASDPSVQLGPSIQRSSGAADNVAKTAHDALNAAAGGAEVSQPDLSNAQQDAQEQALLDLVNQDRAANGLAPVAFDPVVLSIARARAADQLQDGAPLSHVDALGQLVFMNMLVAANVPYQLAGENLARSTNDSAVVDRLNTALMNSPTHRENILEPVFNYLAIGAARDASGRIAFAQIFREN